MIIAMTWPESVAMVGVAMAIAAVLIALIAAFRSL